MYNYTKIIYYKQIDRNINRRIYRWIDGLDRQIQRNKEWQLYEKISQSKKRLLLEKLLRMYNYEKIIYYRQIDRNKERQIQIDRQIDRYRI